MILSARAFLRVGNCPSRWSGSHPTGRPAAAPASAIGAAPMAAVLLVCAAEAWAEHECGAPEAGVEVICSPSNYDPSRDGNIFYGPDEANDDVTIRLSEGLSIDYDRETPGDDVYVPPDDPENPRYSAVWVTPWEADSGRAGGISLTSFADVTSNGRGISVGHYGESGPLRMEILGGSITTTGEGSWAIHSYREGAGDIDVSVRNVPVHTDGPEARAILAAHHGEGAIHLDVRDAALATMGAESDGVYSLHAGTGDLTIGFQNVDIATAGRDSYGVVAIHRDAGRLDISAEALAIETTGALGRGIYGAHSGTGDVGIRTQNGAVSTTGANAVGVLGLHLGQGDLAIGLREADISAAGFNAYGVVAIHRDAGRLDVSAQALAMEMTGVLGRGIYGVHLGAGDAGIRAQRGVVSTTGAQGDGMYGLHAGEGDLRLHVQGLTVTTTGDEAEGIFAGHAGEGDVHVDLQRTDLATMGAQAEGLLAEHRGVGPLNVALRNLAITTAGHYAEGIFAAHTGMGPIDIDARDLTIATTGEGSDATLAGHTNDGDLRVSVRHGALSTSGAEARGVGGIHKGDGTLVVDLRETAIATTGERADGVASEHEGSGSLRINVDGGAVHATGPHANAIRLGRLNRAGRAQHAAGPDDAGFPDQRVTVNGPILGGSGEGAGVFLAGGGRVVIGPRGSLRAESGIAIRAAGDAPKLRVDMDLDRRKVVQVIGDHVIRNDGGETTILVNGVVLHEGASGATGLEARNGAWNVALVGSDTVAGRVFSRADFRAVYAPRAAVYEALPGYLLRLDARELRDARVTRRGAPGWVRLSGARESYAPDRASVGAEYTISRFAAEAGLEVAVGEDAAVFVVVRRLRGSADVTSTTGGGTIETRGSGMAIGVAIHGSDARYVRGRFALANYTSDLSSNAVGRLASGIDARTDSLDLEAGRHFVLDDNLQLAPRIWMARSAVAVDGFSDPTDSRVSVRGITRVTGGVGVVAGMASPRTRQGGALSLRGSLDLARTLGATRTSVDVSGEALESVPPGTRLLLGLGGTYESDRFSLGVTARVGGLLAGEAEYAAQVGFGWKL